MKERSQEPCYLGIDVGTGSARARLFDASGGLLGVAAREIRIWRDAGDIAEQSSDDIWAAVVAAVREVVAQSGVEPARVAGIGFDATCSLVVLDATGTPLSVSTSGDPVRNIVVWMDHRAISQAERISAIRHSVLDFVGGRISPEMETPKLLWLKEKLPDVYRGAGHFFDLTDYLTWRATGDEARSVCTVTCKWTYLAHEKRWDASYFEQIGLEELVADGFRLIGARVVEPSTALGVGLTKAAARDSVSRPKRPSWRG